MCFSESSFRLADLLNASQQCDLFQLCLDRFLKTPDVGVLLETVSQPVRISCRRQREGGRWKRDEDDRVRLLHNAIVAVPAYVELDVEPAERVPRFASTNV